MMQQGRATIFLTDHRESEELEGYRNEFVWDKRYGPSTGAFPTGIDRINLTSLHSVMDIAVPENNTLMLIPVIGAIRLEGLCGGTDLIAAGQMQFLTRYGYSKLRVSNPFRDGAVQFLQVYLSSGENSDMWYPRVSYDVNAYPDQLIDVTTQLEGYAGLPIVVRMGRFRGRTETHLKGKDTGVFTFVLSGAFEVQGRLLHAMDGLAVCDVDEIEIEAFANDSIILILE
jgi:hypothetical protein